MKRIILTLLLAPFLAFSQGPSFTITDYFGNEYDSNQMLAEGTTIIINFYSPSMTCWPSSNSIELLTDAYNRYSGCNKIFFLQVAEWGSESQVVNFLNTFGSLSIPTLIGDEGGQSLTYQFMNWGLEWANELWILRPDGSYESDIPFSWDIEQTVLLDLLENEGFLECDTSFIDPCIDVDGDGILNEDDPDIDGDGVLNHMDMDIDNDGIVNELDSDANGDCIEDNTLGLENYKLENEDKNIYDLQGRVINEIPKSGFYIKGGKKYCVIK